MKLSSIKLVNFKNYKEEVFHFDNKIISIVGNNGVGKTNLLDAIYYTCIGKSNFQSSDKLIIKNNEEFFRIESLYHKNGDEFKINIKVRPGSLKEVEVNGNKIAKLSDHVGLIPVVIICPDDIMNLLMGNEERRNFINNTIIQYDKEYLLQLNTYNKLLKQRNALLKDFSDRKYFDEDLLNILTSKMDSPAQFIHEKRIEFAKNIKPLLEKYGRLLSSEKEFCRFEYNSQLSSESFLEKSYSKINIDKITCRTNTGIHKDEVEFYINDFLIKDHASQGQLKTYIFALKLAQYHLLKEKTHQKPIFLLDDIFDKLDKIRVSLLLNLLIDLEIDQVFITSTDKSKLESIINDSNLISEIEITS